MTVSISVRMTGKIGIFVMSQQLQSEVLSDPLGVLPCKDDKAARRNLRIKLLKTNMGVAKAIFYPYTKTVPQHNMKASVFFIWIFFYTQP